MTTHRHNTLSLSRKEKVLAGSAAALSASALALGIMAHKTNNQVKTMGPGIENSLEFNKEQNLSAVDQPPLPSETQTQLHAAGEAEAKKISAPLEHKIHVRNIETDAFIVDVALAGGLAVGAAVSAARRREQ